MFCPPPRTLLTSFDSSPKRGRLGIVFLFLSRFWPFFLPLGRAKPTTNVTTFPCIHGDFLRTSPFRASFSAVEQLPPDGLPVFVSGIPHCPPNFFPSRALRSIALIVYLGGSPCLLCPSPPSQFLDRFLRDPSLYFFFSDFFFLPALRVQGFLATF